MEEKRKKTADSAENLIGKVEEIKNRKVWNNFIIGGEGGNFLQLWSWGDFQKSLGKSIFRFGFRQKGKLKALALIITEKFPFLGAEFYYLPYGPVFAFGLSSQSRKKILEAFIKETMRRRKGKNIVFLRIEPLVKIAMPRGGQKALRRIQPHQTLVLSLRKSPDELFAHFSQKTRYNIRIAERKGVKVTFSKKYNPRFYYLLKQTAARKGFSCFPEDYYKKLLSVEGVEMCTASIGGRFAVATIAVFQKPWSASLHSSVDRKYSRFKASALLRWEIIKRAMNKGCLHYDFWGFDEKKWPGFSYFKKGFGGKLIRWPEGIDVPYSKTFFVFYRAYVFCRNNLRFCKNRLCFLKKKSNCF